MIDIISIPGSLISDAGRSLKRLCETRLFRESVQ